MVPLTIDAIINWLCCNDIIYVIICCCVVITDWSHIPQISDTGRWRAMVRGAYISGKWMVWGAYISSKWMVRGAYISSKCLTQVKWEPDNAGFIRSNSLPCMIKYSYLQINISNSSKYFWKVPIPNKFFNG